MRGLYAIVDPEQTAGRDPLVLAQAVLRGGCCALQLRAKALSDGAYLALAAELAQVCARHGTPLVINDRVEIAAALHARWRDRGLDVGLHLGQDDAPLAQARPVFSGRIGLSTHSLDQVREAHTLGADLIGFGPVFATRSKVAPDPMVGLSGLRAACSASAVPVVAIGGIGADNLGEVLAAGARVYAVLGALARADDPEATARELHAAIAGTA